MKMKLFSFFYGFSGIFQSRLDFCSDYTTEWYRHGQLLIADRPAGREIEIYRSGPNSEQGDFGYRQCPIVAAVTTIFCVSVCLSVT